MVDSEQGQYTNLNMTSDRNRDRSDLGALNKLSGKNGELTGYETHFIGRPLKSQDSHGRYSKITN